MDTSKSAARTKTERKNEWNSQNYERVTLMVKTGDRDKLKAAAEAEKVSVNRFIIESVNAQHPGLLSPLDDTSKQKKEPGAEG